MRSALLEKLNIMILDKGGGISEYALAVARVGRDFPSGFGRC